MLAGGAKSITVIKLFRSFPAVMGVSHAFLGKHFMHYFHHIMTICGAVVASAENLIQHNADYVVSVDFGGIFTISAACFPYDDGARCQ